MEADREFCHRCNAVTLWKRGKGGRFVRCSGCKDRFPCAHKCDHVDCRDQRGEPEPEAIRPPVDEQEEWVDCGC